MSEEVIYDTDKDGKSNRVHRGGSWYNDVRHLQVSFRDRFEPGFHSVDLGFSCVQTEKAEPGVEETIYDADEKSEPVLRGACWYNDVRLVRASDRGMNNPGLSGVGLGFRCVRTDMRRSLAPTWRDLNVANLARHFVKASTYEEQDNWLLLLVEAVAEDDE